MASPFLNVSDRSELLLDPPFDPVSGWNNAAGFEFAVDHQGRCAKYTGCCNRLDVSYVLNIGLFSCFAQHLVDSLRQEIAVGTSRPEYLDL